MDPSADQKTLTYFNDEAPDYGTYRLHNFVRFIKENGPGSMIDIGCGNGVTLEFFKEQAGVQDVFGVDVSTEYLKQAESRGLKVAHKSVLDDTISEVGQFDYCNLFLVLHHLIGPTRKASFEIAQQAVDNCFSVIKPGGHLLLIENTCVPNSINFLAFYIKKIFSHLTPSRLDMGSIFNIGNPVVSYLDDKRINGLVEGHGEVVSRYLIQWLTDAFIHTLCVGYVIKKHE